jgi:flagellum-specific ATP synthase
LPPDTRAQSDNALQRLGRALQSCDAAVPLLKRGGRVIEINANRVVVDGLGSTVTLGSTVEIETDAHECLGEVVAIDAKGATIELFMTAPRIGLGTRVWLRDDLVIRPDRSWLGRVVDPLGRPLDGSDLLQGARPYRIDGPAPSPMALDRVRDNCRTGIRVFDVFTPICKGQRIGIFAGSGVGKSTLISMLTRAEGFDTVVAALVAERGREVREFIEDVIAPVATRVVVIVATSSESAILRKLSAETAMAVAEYFRDCGDDVLLVVDSLTRYAHALRSISMTAGEPPVARGYAPSVFSKLPRLLERAGPGTADTGSITGIFSVLVDGDDHNEPIADAARGILDGHIVLDRAIAARGRFPAVDVLQSISRLAPMVWSEDEALLVRRLRTLISRHEDTRELRTMGAYKAGIDPELDHAVRLAPLLDEFFAQDPAQPRSANAFAELATLLATAAAKPVPSLVEPGPVSPR